MIHTALNVSWELPLGMHPYFNCRVSIFTWNFFQYGKSVFFTSISLFLFLNFPISVNDCASSPRQKFRTLFYPSFIAHSQLSAGSHGIYPKTLSAFFFFSIPVTTAWCLVPQQFCLDCGFPSSRLSLLQHTLQTDCCKGHANKMANLKLFNSCESQIVKEALLDTILETAGRLWGSIW